MLSTFGIPMDELAQQRREACEGEGHYFEDGVCIVCGFEKIEEGE